MWSTCGCVSDEGEQVGLLETENATVHEWANAVVSRHLSDAQPIG